VKSLSELFHEIGHTDKHTTHGYDKFYAPLLQPRALTTKNFLEIGVAEFGGGCLKAFCEFFPNAQVHGIDVKNTPAHNRSTMLELPENGHFHLGDAYNEAVLDSTFGDTKWDIVLDDGPHTKESQVACFNLYHTRLAEDGMIIVEDVEPASVQYIFEHFSGDKNRLSVIDRRLCPHSNWDEIILIYM
jgi:predicted O-methyltransferase YrrM